MIDVHAHLCFPGFDADRAAVVAAAKQKINGVIVSSASWTETEKVLPLVQAHAGFLFASLGHHPIDSDRAGEPADALERFEAYARAHAHELTAIGEVGLDYHWEKDLSKQKAQRAVFSRLIALAEELQKPLVLHSWDAERDCFELVKKAAVPAVIFHCYTGPLDLAQEIAKAGFFVSISTNVLFSKKLRKIAKALPLEALTLETDSPFLDPDRERRRNTPVNILLSAKKIAEERGCLPEEILSAAKDNAVKALSLTLRKPG